MEMLLTVDQAAERLQLSPLTVQRQLKRGVLRGIKRGRQWRVPESALTEVAPGRGPEPNPLARALSLVSQLENELRGVPARVAGVNDAASELRQLREERAQ